MEQVQRYCCWHRICETIDKYIKGRVMCSTSKLANRKIGLYMPLPIPLWPWDNISMDFVGGFPMSRRGHDYLYILVNKFNKMCILNPCKKQAIAKQTTKMFFNQVWVHFGLPTSIIYDWDTHFVGEFGSTLWEIIDTKLKKSTTFHPKTDGQNQVVYKKIIHILRGYCTKHPKLWDESLSYVKHAYNRALHSSSNQSPFETCFGYLPKSSTNFMFDEEDKVGENDDANNVVKFTQWIQ